MTDEQVENLQETEFERLCGSKPEIFEEMVSTLKQELPTSRKRDGQPKLGIEDLLLITLKYFWGLMLLRRYNGWRGQPFLVMPNEYR